MNQDSREAYRLLKQIHGDSMVMPNVPIDPLYEPTGDSPVFFTQHSTPENRAIARAGLILLTEIGSTMHGVSDPSTGDDVDEMGICIEPPEQVLGLGNFEQYEYRSQPVNARSGPGDIDRTIYSLRKWVKLCAAGNPTVLMPLFADEHLHTRFANWAGKDLRAHKDLFLSKQAGHKFLGYLDGQRQRYMDPNRVDSKHASRPELIEQFGWDTKTGYHALRLAIQGKQVMDHQNIIVPMLDDTRTFLLKVRAGGYTKENVIAMLDEVFIPQLKAATERSSLPEKPDYQKINDWLVQTYQDFWDYQQTREELGS